MKLFLATVLISLMSFSSVSQAYTVYDLIETKEKKFPEFSPFAIGENTPTWGRDNRLEDGASITYSFTDYFIENEISYQDTISSAFDAWASVANLSFSVVTDQSGDIIFDGKRIDGPSETLAFTRLSILMFSDEIETTSYISNVSVDFDIAEPWSLSDNYLSLYDVALHEIGHALGLNHPPPEDPSVSALMNERYTGISSLQEDDINGIQYLYGASVSPVPEPSTYLMFLLGLAMVAGYGRRVAFFQK